MKEPDSSNKEYNGFKESLDRVIGHLKKQKEKGIEVDNIYTHLDAEKNHKFLFTPIIDDNIIFHEEIWQNLNQAQKRQLNNCLFTIYLNISACYLKMSNYYEALTSLEDAIKINEKNAVLYFRRSQALAYNKDSHLDDLYQAKIDLFQAREIMIYENKINKKDKGNVEEKFLLEYYKYLEERIHDRKKYEKIVITCKTLRK